MHSPRSQAVAHQITKAMALVMMKTTTPVANMMVEIAAATLRITGMNTVPSARAKTLVNIPWHVQSLLCEMTISGGLLGCRCFRLIRCVSQ